MMIGNILNRSFLIQVILAAFLFPVIVGADSLNQRVVFNVNEGFDEYKRTSLAATLRHVGNNAYFYVEDSYWNNLNSARQSSLLANLILLSDKFDSDIYPIETQFFGSEPKPGIDGDNRITILVHDLVKNTGGYFDTANGFSTNQISGSNQREMIFMNVDVIESDQDFAQIFLAHEFQHLISFNQKEKTFNMSEDVWLNELRSEYAISKVGLNNNYDNSNLRRRATSFLNDYSDSLTEWPNKSTDYNVVALFGEYLVEQFGENIISETLRMPLTGMASLNKYLSDKRLNLNFNDIYLNWLVALYLNNTSIDSKFGYIRPELSSLKISPQQRVFLSGNLSEYTSTQNLKDWQPVWVEYDVDFVSSDPSRSFKIEISADPGQSFIASYVAFYNSGGAEKIKVGKFSLSGSRGEAFILNNYQERVRKIIVLSAKNTKTSAFSESENPSPIYFKISQIDSGEVKSNIIQDGSLIKRPREKEIYVVRGPYKRYLNPGVISLYGHLNPTDAIEVGPEIFNSYQTSNYVKYVNDEKVYAIWPDGTKHWLNITPRQWDDSRRDWNAIFTINDLELNYYKSGLDITR